ncbi:hypothetical protein [Sphingobacterium pedocola]|uniref:hypothetical protein n=1 Tax=Sphingobacterium pedocola TaxID=2082722 RepID=UPI001E469670|nr:hypothetical protein [Sphingobacterium pedocola]
MLNQNYKISFIEMDRLAIKANSEKSKISLEAMRAQVKDLKNKSVSKVKKKSLS